MPSLQLLRLKFDISAPLPSFPSIKDAKYTLFLHFHSLYRGEARLPLLTSLPFTAPLMPQAALLQIKITDIKFFCPLQYPEPLTLTLRCFHMIPLSEYDGVVVPHSFLCLLLLQIIHPMSKWNGVCSMSHMREHNAIASLTWTELHTLSSHASSTPAPFSLTSLT